jgi:heme/copper-type cytochrome/quinol oxidase subunit 2
VRLQGAGSGRVAQAELSVMASGTTVATAETPSPWWTRATVAATVATGLVLIVVVASLVTTIARRRRARRAGQQRVRRTGTPSSGGR